MISTHPANSLTTYPSLKSHFEPVYLIGLCLFHHTRKLTIQNSDHGKVIKDNDNHCCEHSFCPVQDPLLSFFLRTLVEFLPQPPGSWMPPIPISQTVKLRLEDMCKFG